MARTIYIELFMYARNFLAKIFREIMYKVSEDFANPLID